MEKWISFGRAIAGMIQMGYSLESALHQLLGNTSIRKEIVAILQQGELFNDPNI